MYTLYSYNTWYKYLFITDDPEASDYTGVVLENILSEGDIFGWTWNKENYVSVDNGNHWYHISYSRTSIKQFISIVIQSRIVRTDYYCYNVREYDPQCITMFISHVNTMVYRYSEISAFADV